MDVTQSALNASDPKRTAHLTWIYVLASDAARQGGVDSMQNTRDSTAANVEAPSGEFATSTTFPPAKKGPKGTATDTMKIMKAIHHPPPSVLTEPR